MVQSYLWVGTALSLLAAGTFDHCRRSGRVLTSRSLDRLIETTTVIIFTGSTTGQTIILAKLETAPVTVLFVTLPPWTFLTCICLAVLYNLITLELQALRSLFSAEVHQQQG